MEARIIDNNELPIILIESLELRDKLIGLVEYAENCIITWNERINILNERINKLDISIKTNEIQNN